MTVRGFIDVTPDKWFYDDVMDCANYLLEDESPLVVGIPYCSFEAGKPNYIKEFKGNGQVIFTLDVALTITPDNPLLAYVDGVQTFYREAKEVNGKTTVTMYAPVNGQVLFKYIGSPRMRRIAGTNTPDGHGKPAGDCSPDLEYPHYQLNFGKEADKSIYQYVYNPNSRTFFESVTCAGTQLKRVHIPDGEWYISNHNELLAKYIGDKPNLYTITPGGNIHCSFNVANMKCAIRYQMKVRGILMNTGGEFIPASQKVKYLDRFFPDGHLTRAEAFTVIDRLRRSYYQRFTDSEPPSAVINDTFVAESCQDRFVTTSRFRVGEQLEVKINGFLKQVGIDYVQANDHTILFKYNVPEGSVVTIKRTKQESFFWDGRLFDQYLPDGSPNPKNLLNTWYRDTVISMENERTRSGDELVVGIPHGDVIKFDGDEYTTRAQAVVLLNRFRKWAVETFKG